MKGLICLAITLLITTGISAQSERIVITHPDFGNDFKKVKGGAYAANAGSAEVDRFASSFNHGVAVVQKGNAYALIDAKGQFVVPFNAYSFIQDKSSELYGHRLTKSGLFGCTKPGGVSGVINYEGKLIGPDASHKITQDFASISYTLRPPNKYILPDGATFTSGLVLNSIANGIGFTGTKNTHQFYTLDGKKIFEGELDFKGEYVDGMCVVGKKDQYGVLRYGFINNKGELAVPFQFSVRPSNFSSGYAKVKPANAADLAYGYIDKKGNVVFRHSVADKTKEGEFGDFIAGIAISTTRMLMDTTFQPITYREFFNKLGLPESAQLYDWPRTFFEVENGAVMWFTDGSKTVAFNRPLIGFINFRDKIIVLPSFAPELGSPGSMQFDPIAGLMPAKLMTGRNETTRSPEYVEGMINRKGEFEMVLGKKSVW